LGFVAAAFTFIVADWGFKSTAFLVRFFAARGRVSLLSPAVFTTGLVVALAFAGSVVFFAAIVDLIIR
jgi:hypothetical protein